MRKIIRVKTEAWRETVTLRGRTNGARAFCEACKQAVRFVTPESAAAMLRTNTRDVYRGIEAGDFHFIEVDQIALLVCINSLEKSLINHACSDQKL